jgi:hypothetical protein
MEHNHDHHDHSHTHDPQETLALLRYMLDHNRHHSEELLHLAEGRSEATAGLIRASVEQLEQGNALLAQAVAQMEKEI